VTKQSIKQYYVYILTNKWNKVFYTGVTSNLIKRVWEHKEKIMSGFTRKYNADKLVYFEVFDSILEAIKREKQIKAGSRKKKLDLIKKENSNFRDLYDEII